MLRAPNRLWPDSKAVGTASQRERSGDDPGTCSQVAGRYGRAAGPGDRGSVEQPAGYR